MRDMRLYPIKFEPIYKQRIWGGQQLKTVFNKNIPADEKIGESWELADLPKDKSVVANGELAGLTISKVMKKYRKEIFGIENPPKTFPLLIKILDAQDVLSVQVHPDQETCRRMGKGQAKTECWYIIATGKDPFIYKGLKQGVSKELFAKAIEEGGVEKLLEKVRVRQGQCHFIPAGTAHAIGAGLLIAEIQTPSDTTYRVYDWNRVDKNGKARELHIKEALESVHFDKSDELPVTTAGRLVDCEYFKVDKFWQNAESEMQICRGQMKTLMIISGSGVIMSEETEDVEFGAGETILLPAVLEGKMLFEMNSEFLQITI
jgi:mannose-6-phosphate isomerase